MKTIKKYYLITNKCIMLWKPSEATIINSEAMKLIKCHSAVLTTKDIYQTMESIVSLTDIMQSEDVTSRHSCVGLHTSSAFLFTTNFTDKLYWQTLLTNFTDKLYFKYKFIWYYMTIWWLIGKVPFHHKLPVFTRHVQTCFSVWLPVVWSHAMENACVSIWNKNI